MRLDEIREREDRVVTLTQAGMSAHAIGREVGLTARTVVRIRSRRGVARPKSPLLTDDELRWARTLLDDGCSFAEVARTIGRSATAVREAFPGRGWTRSQLYELISVVQRYRRAI